MEIAGFSTKTELKCPTRNALLFLFSSVTNLDIGLPVGYVFWKPSTTNVYLISPIVKTS